MSAKMPFFSNRAHAQRCSQIVALRAETREIDRKTAKLVQARRQLKINISYYEGEVRPMIASLLAQGT